jgi:NADPH-dependent curcumin reductase CurA
MSRTNRVVRLKQRPTGTVTAGDFAILEEPLAEPKDGEIRVRTAYVSLDPAMRGWIAEGRSYVEPVAVGDVMRAFAAGHVELSRHPKFAVGDAVTGLLGVQSHAVSDGRGVIKVDEQLAPLPRWLGGLGMPGLTAYFGLKQVAGVSPGETVVV